MNTIWVLSSIFKGTIVAKIRLAYNATKAIEQQKLLKEIKIEQAVRQELEQRQNSWDTNKQQFESFQRWYTDYQKKFWHKFFWIINNQYIKVIKFI